jgi:hypothetical protein
VLNWIAEGGEQLLLVLANLVSSLEAPGALGDGEVGDRLLGVLAVFGVAGLRQCQGLRAG